MFIPGQEEVRPWVLGLCFSVPCSDEGGSQGPVWGLSLPISPGKGSQGPGICDCSLVLERKLVHGGMG